MEIMKWFVKKHFKFNHFLQKNKTIVFWVLTYYDSAGNDCFLTEGEWYETFL